MTAIFQGPDPALPPSRRMMWRCPLWLRRVGPVAGMGLALCLLTIMALVWLGFPQSVTRRLLASINSGDYHGEVQHLALDWRGGLAARDVRLYRKGVVGPPFLEARDVRVLFNIFHPGRMGWGRLKSVAVSDGVMRPLLAPPTKGTSGAGARAAGFLIKADSPLDVVVTLAQFDCLGVWVESLTGAIRMDDKGGEARGLSGQVGREQQRGGMRGRCSWTWAQGVHGRMVTSFDPHILMPLGLVLDAPETSRVLEWFSFPSTPPSCDLTFDYTCAMEGYLVVTGRLQAANFAYRGAGIAFANVVGTYDGSLGHRRMSLNPLVLVVGGRNASGNVTVDFDAGRADFEVVSTIDVPTLARIVGVRKGGILDDCRFGRGSRVYAKGTVGYDNPACSDMEAVVEGPEIGVGRYVADECSFKFMMKGPTNLLADVRGKMGGGSFAGSVAFIPEASGADARTRYEVKAELFHVDLQWLRNLLNTNSTVTGDGKLFGNLELSGRMGAGQGDTATGKGYLSLRRGFVFRLPLFGGMTELLTKALPGLDFAIKQTDVRMPFEVKEGRIISRDVQIEGDVLSLTAKGDCTLDGKLAFDVQVRPMKDKTLLGQAMRVLTYPISRLFEFRLEGTIDQPRWSLFNLPRDSRGMDPPQKDGNS